MSYLVLPWSFMYFILLCTGIINLSMNILAPSLPKLLKHGFMIFLGGYVLESSYVEQIFVKITVASQELPRKRPGIPGKNSYYLSQFFTDMNRINTYFQA